MTPSALAHAIGKFQRHALTRIRGARVAGFCMTLSELVALRGEVIHTGLVSSQDKLRGSLSVALGACVIQTHMDQTKPCKR